MTDIKIKDLRGVGDVELNLDDTKRVFVFFGSNGVGKTKTLEALALFNFAKVYDINSYEFQIRLIPVKNIFASSITVGKETINLIKLITNGQIQAHRIFSQTLEKAILATVFIGAGNRIKINADSNSHELESYKTTLNKQELINIIYESTTNGSYINLSMDNHIHKWFLERAKSVNPYQKEEDNRKVDIDTVLNALHILDSRIEKTLKIDGDGNVFLTIEGQERELSELSSGFISVVKIIQSIISAYSAFTNATDLLNVKGVVLIDEIESHLHIEWQTKIVPTLKNLFPNTTFYIATHSPLVLSQLAEGEAYLLKRDADGVVRSQEINSPNTRLLANVMRDTFDVDLNQLKRDNIANIDQTKVKQKLLALMNEQEK